MHLLARKEDPTQFFQQPPQPIEHKEPVTLERKESLESLYEPSSYFAKQRTAAEARGAAQFRAKAAAAMQNPPVQLSTTSSAAFAAQTAAERDRERELVRIRNAALPTQPRMVREYFARAGAEKQLQNRISGLNLAGGPAPAKPGAVRESLPQTPLAASTDRLLSSPVAASPKGRSTPQAAAPPRNKYSTTVRPTPSIAV